MKQILLFAALFPCVSEATTIVPSDCQPGRADGSCLTLLKVPDQTGDGAPGVSPIYDGPIAGQPQQDTYYWGFDYLSASRGVQSPLPNSMYVNRSTKPISLVFTFDIPPNCGAGCMPGMEFKLNAKWDSFFPNMISANGHAITSVVIAPGQPYGFAIALWRSTNPRLTATVVGKNDVILTASDIGLASEMGISQWIQGTYYQCSCGDGRIQQCYTGGYTSNGMMGVWYKDGFTPADAIGC